MKSSLIAIAASAMLLAGCATQVPTDSGCCAPKCGTCAPAPCCKGLSSCKTTCCPPACPPCTPPCGPCGNGNSCKGNSCKGE